MKLAVIGDPIKHSLSPVVHGAILEQLKLTHEYQKIQVKKGELERFLRFALEENLSGFNLTMPHKIDIFPYLEDIDEEARRFGAVNTVRVSNGKFYGYNTDADGYALALKQAGRSFAGKRIILLGAGGVARTLALKAGFSGADQIWILNRTASAAEEICQDVIRETGVKAVAADMDRETMRQVCCGGELLINATPLGMEGVTANFSDFSFLDSLSQDSVVSDLIYHPEKTLLLKQAEDRGLSVFNGLGMLVFQAMLADEIYTGKAIDKEGIFSKVCDIVKNG